MVRFAIENETNGMSDERVVLLIVAESNSSSTLLKGTQLSLAQAHAIKPYC